MAPATSTRCRSARLRTPFLGSTPAGRGLMAGEGNIYARHLPQRAALYCMTAGRYWNCEAREKQAVWSIGTAQPTERQLCAIWHLPVIMTEP